MSVASERLLVGRYALHDLIGSGGMARVYVGRLEGWAGFSKAVAVKRLHPDLASDPELSAMLLDEARLTAHIRHPNVVSTIDVVREEGEFLLVMDYVVGVSLDVLQKRARAAKAPIEESVVVAVVSGILRGLHAAHEATDETGKPLHIVHRDMSPPNVVIEESGVAKILDFGIATAADRLTTTKEGTVKGKPAYIAPEQLTRGTVDRRADVFAVGVVLWEMLAGERLRPNATFHEAMNGVVGVDARALRSDAARALGVIAEKAMALSPDDRYPTAASMAEALEAALAPASPSHVSAWCLATAPETLEARRNAARTATGARTESAAATTSGAAPTDIVTDVVAREATLLVVPAAADGEVRVRRAGRSVTTLALVLLGGLAIAGGAFATSRRAPEPSTSIAVAASNGSASASMVASASSATAEASVAVSSSIPGGAVAAPPSSSPSAGPKVARPAHGVGARAHPPKPSSAACRDPFVIGPDGMKIPKRECL